MNRSAWSRARNARDFLLSLFTKGASSNLVAGHLHSDAVPAICSGKRTQKINIHRVIEDQVDLTVVGYGMGVRWSMHPSSAMHFRVVDLQKTRCYGL